jgi:dUTP pyrophosphatase
VVDIPVMLVDDKLEPPVYARTGDAGADLVARTGVVVAAGGGRARIPTGVRLAIPEGYAGFVQPRSGLAWRHGITLVNSPGLIDSGYRDEISVIVINTDPVEDFEIRPGDRIAQLVVQRVERACFVPVGELPESDRGLGGFGHTGR